MKPMHMNSSLTRTARTVLSAAILVLAAGSIAMAQPSGNSPAGGPVGLGGPRVKDTNPPGARNGFGEGSTQISKKDRPVDVPFPAFVKTVNDALADGKSALSADQKTKIETIASTFRDAEKTFRQTHGKELRELMNQLGIEGPGGGRGRPGGPNGAGGPPHDGPAHNGPPGDGPDQMGEPGADRPDGGADRPPRGPRPEGGPGGKGGRGGKGGGPGGPGGPDGASKDRPQLTPDQREALMTKMRELREKGPNQDDSKKAVWSVLSSDQQAAVQPKLDAFIKERTEERARRMAEGQAAKKVKELDAQSDSGETKPRKNPDRPARPLRQPSPDQPSPDAPK